tara:strand:- start:42384 stop:42665 length:282 start_codon:yes stop_codon:yes gene_type:complete
MSKRDQELICWFREVLKVSQVDLQRILNLTEPQLYSGVRRKYDYFQPYEFAKLIAFLDEHDKVKSKLLRLKIEKDFWDFDLSEIEKAAEYPKQ